MKRRKALQTIGWGLSGGTLLPSLITACAPKDPGPEIVYSGSVAVIGAGAAGMYVADILHSKGIKVAIYEAGDQIGGRVRSLRNQTTALYPDIPFMSSDFPVELGAQMIIGSDSILGKVFQVQNLRTTEFPPATTSYVIDNLVKSQAEWVSDPDYTAAMNFRKNLRTQAGNSRSVQQAITAAGINTRVHGMLNGQIGNTYGSNNETIGIGELGEEETLRANDGKILTLTANPFQDVLISRFNAVQSLVKLNTPIASIEYGGDTINLTAKDGTVFTAEKVIVTVPVSVLKTGGLTFSPGLPGSFSGSLAKFGMGPSVRVILEFKKNFWGESIGYIHGSANVPEYLSLGMSRSIFNSTLSVTVHGSKAQQYSALGDGMADAILADIDALYPGPPTQPGLGTQFIRKEIDKTTNLETDNKIMIVQDWTKTDYIKGGYSYPLPGATNNDRKAIGQPVAGKVFFAGEATDITGQAGMVNGALASAERAAQEVIEAIKTGA